MSQKHYKKGSFSSQLNTCIYFTIEVIVIKRRVPNEGFKTMLLSTAAGLLLNLTANSVSAHHVNAEHHFKVTAQMETDPVASGDDAADDPAIWIHEKHPEKAN